MSISGKIAAGCCGCAVLVLGGIIATFFYLGRDGVLSLLSNAFPKPEPTRVVVVDASVMAGIASLRPAEVTATSTVWIVTEQQLTALFRQALTTGEQPLFTPETQVVALASELEIQGTLLQPFHLPVLVGIQPSVDAQGEIQLGVSELNAGGLPITPTLADQVLQQFDDRLPQVAQALAPLGTVESVTIVDGALQIRFISPTP